MLQNVPLPSFPRQKYSPNRLPTIGKLPYDSTLVLQYFAVLVVEVEIVGAVGAVAITGTHTSNPEVPVSPLGTTASDEDMLKEM